MSELVHCSIRLPAYCVSPPEEWVESLPDEFAKLFDTIQPEMSGSMRLGYISSYVDLDADTLVPFVEQRTHLYWTLAIIVPSRGVWCCLLGRDIDEAERMQFVVQNHMNKLCRSVFGKSADECPINYLFFCDPKNPVEGLKTRFTIPIDKPSKLKKSMLKSQWKRFQRRDSERFVTELLSSEYVYWEDLTEPEELLLAA